MNIYIIFFQSYTFWSNISVLESYKICTKSGLQIFILLLFLRLSLYMWVLCCCSSKLTHNNDKNFYKLESMFILFCPHMGMYNMLVTRMVIIHIKEQIVILCTSIVMWRAYDALCSIKKNLFWKSMSALKNFKKISVMTKPRSLKWVILPGRSNLAGRTL